MVILYQHSKQPYSAQQTMATTCAACGSEGGDNSLKACASCKLVKYCNRDCQIKHRPTHRKICNRAEKGKLTAIDILQLRQLAREAALRRTEDPLKNWVRPAPVECPVCMVPLAIEMFSNTKNKPCFNCGKIVCSGCVINHIKALANEVDKDSGLDVCDTVNTVSKCPFCR